MSSSTKKLCYCAFFTALTAIGTMVIRIPVSATNGYIHIGDSIILLVSFFFGSYYGIFSAGIGSAIADILSGYVHWAIFTLIIKALMAYVMVKISDDQKAIIGFKNIMGIMLAEGVMVVGYFLGAILLEGSVTAALSSVPPNLIQAVGGGMIFSFVGIAFKKAKIIEYLKKMA